VGKPKVVTGISRMVAFNETLLAGAADAIRAGYHEFAKELEKGNLDKTGFDNPILKGSLAGWIAVAEKSSDTLIDAAWNLMFPSGQKLREILSNSPGVIDELIANKRSGTPKE
jgi:hypothetical protein